jgi:AraC-like DNA-binding protein
VSFIDVDQAAAPAFGLADDLEPSQSEWHQHSRHQVLYALRGVLHLEVAGGSWLLPPHRAAFLTAQTAHRVVAERKVALRTVYIAPALLPAPDWDCRVFTVTPLARELVLYATRWSHDSDPADPLLRLYFQTLARLTLEWSERGRLPYRLPLAQSEPLQRATQRIRRQLGSPLAVADIARAAAMSERTLRRHFLLELGMTPQAYLHTARMLSALDRLADPEIPITTVALDVGFATPSAFSHAFLAFAGETPRDYRQRVTSS